MIGVIVNNQKIHAYYEAEGKHLKASDVDRYYRGVFRFFSTHGSRSAILEKWLKLCKPNETFLDVGCELGYFVRKMAARGLKTAGVDISPTKIRKSKQIASKMNLSCDFSVMDAEKLEFESNTFDWVLCSETLEHILNDKRAAQEIVRVSKHNIIVTVPQKSIFWRILNNFSEIYGFDALGAGHLREYNEESLLNLFGKRVTLESLKKGGFLVSVLDRFLPDLSIFKAILCVRLKKVE